MTEEISHELFLHLVELAALELTGDEAEYLRRQLNNQLRAIHELASIPVKAGTPPASHGVPYTTETSPLVRDDDWKAYPDPSAILAGAPETKDGYFLVPDIPHTELE